MYRINSSLLTRSDGKPVITGLAYICLGVIFLAIAYFILLSVKHVTVQIGEEKTAYLTFAPTVSALFQEQGIKTDFGPDRDPSQLKEGESLNFCTLSCGLQDKITDGMQIKIAFNRIEKVAQNKIIPMQVRREWDVFMDPGRQKILDPGRTGVIKDTVIVSYHDGKVLARKTVDSKLVVKPRPSVIAMGSYNAVSRQVPMRLGRVYKFEATGYTHTGYRTAIGAKTRRGIIAVDPRIIPFGTKLYVEGYGYGVAADTGGAIKGRRIDLFFETEREAIKWGRRNVNVHIQSK